MVRSTNPNRVAVSSGDASGVAPELLVELVEDADQRDREIHLELFGPPAYKRWLEERVSTDTNWTWHRAGTLEHSRMVDGEADAETGAAAFKSFRSAVAWCEEQPNLGLLTLPLAKHAVLEAGHDEFRGHTAWLEKHYDERALMSFFGDSFNVGLLTRHRSLESVPGALSPNRVRRAIRGFAAALQQLLGRQPSLGLLGLNPHAGEEGSLGDEEVRVLTPVAETLRAEGFQLDGPAPADSYLPVHGDSVDMVLACYHDQGLAPFKLEHFYTGVHATLGLPLPRVSPDHGVAASIAGEGQVDSRSTLNALTWLLDHGEG